MCIINNILLIRIKIRHVCMNLYSSMKTVIVDSSLYTEIRRFIQQKQNNKAFFFIWKNLYFNDTVVVLYGLETFCTVSINSEFLDIIMAISEFEQVSFIQKKRLLGIFLTLLHLCIQKYGFHQIKNDMCSKSVWIS